jgi:hypothetical protein
MQMFPLSLYSQQKKKVEIIGVWCGIIPICGTIVKKMNRIKKMILRSYSLKWCHELWMHL